MAGALPIVLALFAFTGFETDAATTLLSPIRVDTGISPQYIRAGTSNILSRKPTVETHSEDFGSDFSEDDRDIKRNTRPTVKEGVRPAQHEPPRPHSSEDVQHQSFVTGPNEDSRTGISSANSNFSQEKIKTGTASVPENDTKLPSRHSTEVERYDSKEDLSRTGERVSKEDVNRKLSSNSHLSSNLPQDNVTSTSENNNSSSNDTVGQIYNTKVKETALQHDTIHNNNGDVQANLTESLNLKLVMENPLTMLTNENVYSTTKDTNKMHGYINENNLIDSIKSGDVSPDSTNEENQDELKDNIDEGDQFSVPVDNDDPFEVPPSHADIANMTAKELVNLLMSPDNSTDVQFIRRCLGSALVLSSLASNRASTANSITDVAIKLSTRAYKGLKVLQPVAKKGIVVAGKVGKTVIQKHRGSTEAVDTPLSKTPYPTAPDSTSLTENHPSGLLNSQNQPSPYQQTAQLQQLSITENFSGTPFNNAPKTLSLEPGQLSFQQNEAQSPYSGNSFVQTSNPPDSHQPLVCNIGCTSFTSIDPPIAPQLSSRVPEAQPPGRITSNPSSDPQKYPNSFDPQPPGQSIKFQPPNTPSISSSIVHDSQSYYNGLQVPSKGSPQNSIYPQQQQLMIPQQSHEQLSSQTPPPQSSYSSSNDFQIIRHETQLQNKNNFGDTLSCQPCICQQLPVQGQEIGENIGSGLETQSSNPLNYNPEGPLIAPTIHAANPEKTPTTNPINTSEYSQSRRSFLNTNQKEFEPENNVQHNEEVWTQPQSWPNQYDLPYREHFNINSNGLSDSLTELPVYGSKFPIEQAQMLNPGKLYQTNGIASPFEGYPPIVDSHRGLNNIQPSSRYPYDYDSFYRDEYLYNSPPDLFEFPSSYPMEQIPNKFQQPHGIFYNTELPYNDLGYPAVDGNIPPNGFLEQPYTGKREVPESKKNDDDYYRRFFFGGNVGKVNTQT